MRPVAIRVVIVVGMITIRSLIPYRLSSSCSLVMFTISGMKNNGRKLEKKSEARLICFTLIIFVRRRISIINIPVTVPGKGNRGIVAINTPAVVTRLIRRNSPRTPNDYSSCGYLTKSISSSENTPLQTAKVVEKRESGFPDASLQSPPASFRMSMPAAKSHTPSLYSK